jgi:ribose transport system ATP-binding protein
VDVVDHSTAIVDAIQRKMVGRDVDKEYYREQRQKPYDTSQALLSVAGISLQRKYTDISFDLHAGEVLCFVGTEGSGREAILRTIFGMEQPDQGTVAIKGQQVKNFSPQNGVANGIGYLPRERKVEGIVSGMNVYENMTLSQLPRYSWHGVMKIKEEKALAEAQVRKLSIKTPDIFKDCGGLSGGNQQKVVLAKWRSGGSEILLMDHPTRGLDIGAKEDVYDMIREMSDEGVGIILVADTLEEAIGLSHNIIVLKDGAIQKCFSGTPGAKPNLFDLVHYMI